MGIMDRVVLAELGEALRPRVSYTTLRRYAVEGVPRRSDDIIVKMKIYKLPAGMASTMDDYEQFLEDLNG